VRGDNQLRHVLRLAADTDQRGIVAAVEGAVATFLRAFECQIVPSTTRSSG
jgi:hypothetical protein